VIYGGYETNCGILGDFLEISLDNYGFAEWKQVEMTKNNIYPGKREQRKLPIS